MVITVKLLKRAVPVTVIAALLVVLAFLVQGGFAGRFDFDSVQTADGRITEDTAELNLVRKSLRNASLVKEDVGIDLQYADMLFATVRQDGTGESYSLYIPSMMRREGYVFHLDEEQLYRLDTDDFKQMLSLEVFHGAYHYAQAPKLNLVMEQTKAYGYAKSVNWSYMKPDGTAGLVSVTEENGEAQPFFYGIGENPSISLTFEKYNLSCLPDIWNARIFCDDELVFAGAVSGNEIPVPTISDTYRVEVDAQWNLSVDKDYYGSASYVCDLQMDAPVTLSRSADAVAQGAFLRVFAAIRGDAEQVSISCPKLNYQGKFHPNLDGHVALLAVPYDAEPGVYTYTVTAYGFSRTYEFLVTEGDFASGKLNISSKVDRNDTSEQDQYFIPLRSMESEAVYMTNGAFAEPLKVNYRVSTPFGQYRYTNDNPEPTRHNGVDMAAGGTKPNVYAAGAGKVVLVKELAITGKTVVIDHGMNIHTHYYHLDKVNVTEGDMVDREQKIGVMGSTGYSTGNHLHFTAMMNGTEIDPFLLFETNLMENR